MKLLFILRVATKARWEDGGAAIIASEVQEVRDLMAAREDRFDRGSRVEVFETDPVPAPGEDPNYSNTWFVVETFPVADQPSRIVMIGRHNG